MIRIYTLLALLFSLLSLHAQSFMFKHLEVSDGLSNNSVRCIYKDREGLMWFGTLAGLNCYDGYTFKVFTRQEYNQNSLPDNFIESIVELPDGQFWVKTAKGYVLFDKAKEVFQTDLTPFMTSLGSRGVPSDIFVDSKENVWIYVMGEGCYRYNKNSKPACFSFQEHKLPLVGISDIAECKDGILFVYDTGLLVCVDRDRLTVRWIKEEVKNDNQDGKQIDFSLFVDREECIWIYSISGVWVYDLEKGKWQEDVTERWRNRSDFVHSITQDAKGRIWMGKDYSGIDILTKADGRVVSVSSEKNTDRSLSHNTVYTLYTDRDGIVWVGTYKKGISYYGESIFKFEIDYTGDVTSIEPEGKDKAWLGTNDNGVMLWNYTTRQIEKHFTLGEEPVVALLRASDGKLWVGTFNGDLYCIEGTAVRSFKAGDGSKLLSDKIWALQEDRKGNIWIGFLDAGIQCLNPSDHSFQTIDLEKAGLNDNHIVSLCFTNENDLVIGTASQGVAVFDVESRKIKAVLQEKDSVGITHNEINQVFKDSRGLVWIATRGGLNIYNVKSGKVKGLSDVMPDNGGIIAGVAEDNSGDMWVTSARQLIHLNVTKGDTGEYQFVPHVYNDKDGLQNCDFNLRSIRELNNGAILLGGLYGINVFSPENVRYNKLLPKVLFAGLSLFNKEIQVGERVDGRVLLSESLNRIGKLTLDYKQNIFSIFLASDNLLLPEKTRYMYQLKGFNKEWLSLPEGVHSLTFTNLAPGKYILSAKAVNSDGYIGQDVSSLEIEVLPPFWMSWWAYLLYFMIGVGLLFLARSRLLKREREKFKLHQIELEVAKNEEVNNMKFRFFTNISHELRTPLTLIITPLDMMIRRLTDETMKKQLNTIYKNAQNLLSLVNQLLDFRKLEMKGERLHLMNGDMEEFIVSAYNNFMPMAVEKHLNFVNQSEHRALYMFFDRDKVHKIVNNLLSNAFKYTPEGGTVNLLLATEEVEGRNYVRISVSDTGIGISESDLPYIFDRFYQVGNEGDEKIGSGIGLHLVREYVNIHGGRIKVDSQMDRGSVFTVWLPMDLTPEPDELPDEITDMESTGMKEKETVVSASDENIKKLLLVEDNQEFRTFLKEQLEDFYRIVEAADGEEGERKAIEENPDLIISDIMMPKVDGIELCRRIKTNVQTSHIPVILLTARTADDIKINSYEVGADSYMSKPFNFDMLMVRIEKLIEQQERRKQEFRKNIEVNPSAITITSVDEQLIQKCLEYIEKNMDNPEYGVEELSGDLGMVRMSLYRKLQSITGHTPTDFIRSIRLKRAAQLLQGSRLPIIEIANRVGFSSSSYFSKCFKEMFGMLPKQYAEETGKKE